MNYRGYELYADVDLLICIKGEGCVRFQSVSCAQDYIDKLLKVKKNTERDAINIPVLCYADGNYEITRHVLIGIHPVQKNLMVTPATGERYNFYPDTPSVREALEKLSALEREVDVLMSVLSRYSIEQPSRSFQLDNKGHVGIQVAMYRRRTQDAQEANLLSEVSYRLKKMGVPNPNQTPECNARGGA